MIKERVIILGLALLLLLGVGIFAANHANTGKVYSINLETAIMPDTVAPVQKLLADAKSGDTIRIYVNSPGGSVSDMLTLLYYIKNTKAKVEYIVPYYAMSAAASIMCQLDFKQLIINDAAMIAFHEAGVMVGDTRVPLSVLDDRPPELDLAIESDRMMFEHCKKFLTDEQIEDYLAAKDVFLTGKEMKENYYKRFAPRD